jgi:hypothetical protein
MMRTTPLRLGVALLILAFGLLPSAQAAPFFFSTGNPDGLIGTASRPAGNGKIETESADDFLLTAQTSLTSATFTGLLPTGSTAADVQQVRVEIYRVFPLDSTNPPSNNVPTRNNSPSDVEFVDRDTAAKNLTFSTSVLADSFTAANSVLNGIFPKPNFNTMGEGPVTGQEVQFSVNFTTPFDLPPDHYFFVPQVLLDNGDFFWLSAPKPIVAPGTPFLPDLQEWIRNENLAPDWLRVGADIVGGTAFNSTFSLTGVTPEPATLTLLGLGAAGLAGYGVRRRRQQQKATA